jgi:hypothetical protein
MEGRPAGQLEESKIRLTQPSLAGTGAELGNYPFTFIFVIFVNTFVSLDSFVIITCMSNITRLLFYKHCSRDNMS